MALLQLDLLDQPAPGEGAACGKPLQLALDRIDENPEQPRHEFEVEALRELADTIAERGVRQPISVRRHPVEAGRWILNFGARRLRASRLAGRTEIPAFVDETADTYDQVIENEQRQGLKPLELALFIQRRLASGESRVEIARRLGKSPSYVTLACALIDAPDWLMALYREGRCTGMLELHELRRLHREHPEKVEEWVSAQASIGRSEFERLKEMLVPRGSALAPALASVPRGAGDDRNAFSSPGASQPAPRGASQEPLGLGADPVSVLSRRASARKSPADNGSDSRQGGGPEPLSGRSRIEPSADPRSEMSEGFEPLKGLADAQRTASAALMILRRVIALMDATPVGGPEALAGLRAALMELASARGSALRLPGTNV